MFDLGWAELLIIGVVALIIVGPKDLPVLFRNVGRWVGRVRGMARDFSRAMNDAADEAGVKDVQKTIEAATNPVGTAMQGVKDATRAFTADFDPTRELAKSAEKPAYAPESETGKLAAERAAQAQKIQAATARKTAERLQRQADEALAKAEAAEATIANDATPEPPAEETGA